jgi:hypothetical protein
MSQPITAKMAPKWPQFWHPDPDGKNCAASLLDAVGLAADSVRELPERCARPAARVEQSNRLPRRVRRRSNERRDLLDDGRRRGIVAGFGYAF